MPKGGGFWSHGTHAKRADEDDDGGGPAMPSIPDDIPKPAGIENKDTPEFFRLATLFSKVEEYMSKKHKRPGHKSELLSLFFENWRNQVGPDLYPLIRLMLPERDNRRRTYHLKEQKLGKAYIDALGIPKGSASAMKLEHWKVPTKDDPGAGEFSTVAYEVIKTRSSVLPGAGTMTIEDVNTMLDRLSVAQATVGPDGKRRTIGLEHARILEDCQTKMSAEEQKWLIRIILKDLKIGMGEKLVFNAMHPDAMEYFNTCSDILRVCWKLHNKQIRLPREETTVKPFSVFRPMLCQRNQRDITDIVKKMTQGRPDDVYGAKEKAIKEGKGEWYYSSNELMIEEKLDGERIQLHKDGDKYMYNSRKSTDYTHLYGANPDEGSLTPYIHHLFSKDIKEIILDGEMLVWDPTMKKYIPFGNLKTYAMEKKFGLNDPRPCFKVFDILYLRSSSDVVIPMIGQNPYPLRERKRLLASCFEQKKGVMEVAEVKKASTGKEILSMLKGIVESRGEGIVVKNPESVYVLGGREATWIKVKPDYMDELGETIDAMVIGGYWGQGNRGGRLASFMVGLRNSDPDADEIDGESQFFSFAKVGSGFNMDVYNQIFKQTEGKWFEFDKKKSVPGWFKTVAEFPDVLIRPSDSFVVVIKAAELVGGVDYGAGLTLRFPRAIKLRDDMDETNCMTLDDVRKLQRGTKRGGVDNNLRGKKGAKKVRTADPKAHSISAPLGKITVAGEMFKGLTFFVHMTLKTPATSKADIEKLVLEHGGKVMQKIVDESTVIASEFQPNKGIAVRKGADAKDIISETWILESVKAGRKLPLYERFYARALPETQQSDEYNQIEDDDDDPNAAAAGHPLIEGGDSEEDEIDSVFHKTSRSPSPKRESDDDGRGHDHDTSDDDRSDGGPEPPTDDSDVEDDLPPSKKLISPVGKSRSSSPPVDMKDSSFKMVVEDEEALTDAKPGMGAGRGEAHYDPDKPFAPFKAYFDTSANAETNGLEKAKNVNGQVRADQILASSETAFVKAGGVATSNLQDPNLTHLIVYKSIPDRWKTLTSRTSEPRYRKMVTQAWVNESVEFGEGALDEADFKP